MLLFFIVYLTFTCKCFGFIDDIFDEIEDDLKKNNKLDMFYEKIQNFGIYSYYSSHEGNIMKDLVEINREIGLLDCLKEDEFYFLKEECCFIQSSSFNNEDLRRIIYNILEKFEVEKTREFEKINHIHDHLTCEVVKINKNILKSKNHQEHQSNNEDEMKECADGKKDYKDSLYGEEDEKENERHHANINKSNRILIVSNIILDSDIVLLLYKILRIYREKIGDSQQVLLNFLILKFPDLNERLKINEKIKFFYQKSKGKTPQEIEVLNSFIIGEFKPNKAVLSNSIISENLPLPLFEIFDIYGTKILDQKLKFLKNLELLVHNQEKNLLFSNRPKLNIIYRKDNSIKELIIYDIISNTSLRIFCQNHEKRLDKITNGFRIYKLVSKMSFFYDKEILQEINICNFYIYVNKERKIFGKIDGLMKKQNEILLTEKMYQKIKKNIFLFLKPGFDVFYDYKYIKYDFLLEDFIIQNQHPLEYSFSAKQRFLKPAHKTAISGILSYFKKYIDQYEIYIVNSTNKMNANLKNFGQHWKNKLFGNFTNILSFDQNYIEKKLENIEEINIFLQEKYGNKNNRFFRFSITKVRLEIFIVSYEIIIKNKIEEMEINGCFFDKLLLKIQSRNLLIKEIIKFYKNFLIDISKCKNELNFMDITVKNVNNMKRTMLYIEKYHQKSGKLFPLDQDYFSEMILYIYKHNKIMFEEILKDIEYFQEIYPESLQSKNIEEVKTCQSNSLKTPVSIILSETNNIVYEQKLTNLCGEEIAKEIFIIYRYKLVIINEYKKIIKRYRRKALKFDEPNKSNIHDWLQNPENITINREIIYKEIIRDLRQNDVFYGFFQNAYAKIFKETIENLSKTSSLGEVIPDLILDEDILKNDFIEFLNAIYTEIKEIDVFFRFKNLTYGERKQDYLLNVYLREIIEKNDLKSLYTPLYYCKIISYILGIHRYVYDTVFNNLNINIYF